MDKFKYIIGACILIAGFSVGLCAADNLPDLTVKSISFSNDRPEENEEVTITALIGNTGVGYSEDRFIDHAPSIAPRFWPADEHFKAAQSFYPETDVNLKSVSFMVGLSTPGISQKLTVKLTESSENGGIQYPDMDCVLASMDVSSADLTHEGWRWTEFKFGTFTFLQKGSTYWIVAESTAPAQLGYEILRDATDGGTFERGYAAYYDETENEWGLPDPGRDLLFRVYRPTETIVELYEGHPDSGTLINSEHISPVPEGGERTVSVKWSGSAFGEYKIYVRVDPENYIVETTTDNNIRYEPVFIVASPNQDHIFESETGRITVDIPAGAFNQPYYLTLDENPLDMPLYQPLISEANRKLSGDSDPFSHPVEEHYYKVSAYYADDSPAGALNKDATVEVKIKKDKFEVSSDYLQLLRLDEKNSLWTRVSRYETVGEEHVRGTVGNFSIFSVSGSGDGDLSRAYAFPVPFLADRHEEITFTNLTPAAKINIYTLSGRHVKNIKNRTGNETQAWENPSAESGTYLYIIENDTDMKKGKLVIIR